MAPPNPTNSKTTQNIFYNFTLKTTPPKKKQGGATSVFDVTRLHHRNENSMRIIGLTKTATLYTWLTDSLLNLAHAADAILCGEMAKNYETPLISLPPHS